MAKQSVRFTPEVLQSDGPNVFRHLREHLALDWNQAANLQGAECPTSDKKQIA